MLDIFLQQHRDTQAARALFRRLLREYDVPEVTSFVKNKLRILRWPEEVLRAMREQGLGYSVAGVVVAAPPEQRRAILQLALAGTSTAELREKLLSFRKDKPADALFRVSKALRDRRRLENLGAQERKRVDRLVAQLGQLLSVSSEHDA